MSAAAMKKTAAAMAAIKLSVIKAKHAAKAAKAAKMLNILQLMLLRNNGFFHIYNNTIRLTPSPFPHSNRARGSIQMPHR